MEIFAPIIGLLLFVAIMMLGKRNTPAAIEEAEGIEVFRGERDAVDFALQVLCDGGVPAWIEESEDQQLAIHVEEDHVPLVQHVLQESKLLYA